MLRPDPSHPRNNKVFARADDTGRRENLITLYGFSLSPIWELCVFDLMRYHTNGINAFVRLL